MPKITLVEGLILTNTDAKYGCKGGVRMDNIADIVIWWSIFSFSRTLKVISGNSFEARS